MIRSQIGQRIFGLLMFPAGAGFTAWIWYTALTEGYYYVKSAMVSPVVMIAGLGMMLFPIDLDKLRAEHGVEKIQSFRQLPLAWKLLSIVALAAAFGNWYAIAHF